MKVILNCFAFKWRVYCLVKILIIVLFLTGCATHSARSTRETAVPPVAQAKLGSYRVQPGDTLFSLAWKNNTTVDKLQRINGIKPGGILRAGQVIRLQDDVSNRDLTPPVAAEVETKTVCCLKKKPTGAEPVRKYEISGWANGWIWPVKGQVVAPYSVKGGLNKGIDIKTKLGESVVAASDGEVVFAGNELKGYPNLVILKHGPRFLSAYSNNQTLLVKEGDKVRKGQPIAQMGKVPGATRLHFEIRSDGKPVDPQQLLP